MILQPSNGTDVRPTRRHVQPKLTPQHVDRATAEAIVFGTTVARSVLYTEKPEDIPSVVAKRIWDNFETYFALGEWPVRPEPEGTA